MSQLEQEPMQSMEWLKKLANDRLSNNSTVKRLILSEPDALPFDVALKKTMIYLEMLEKELK